MPIEFLPGLGGGAHSFLNKAQIQENLDYFRPMGRANDMLSYRIPALNGARKTRRNLRIRNLSTQGGKFAI